MPVAHTKMDPNVDMPQKMSGPYIPIPQFYNGRSIFITGGTGFMGKVRRRGSSASAKSNYIASEMLCVNILVFAGARGEIVTFVSGHQKHIFADATETRPRGCCQTERVA